MMKLQYRHLEFGLCTNDAMQTPYWTIRLVNWKGWQRHAGNNREQDLHGLSVYFSLLLN
jgi:hypothetical protein